MNIIIVIANKNQSVIDKFYYDRWMIDTQKNLYCLSRNDQP